MGCDGGASFTWCCQLICSNICRHRYQKVKKYPKVKNKNTRCFSVLLKMFINICFSEFLLHYVQFFCLTVKGTHSDILALKRAERKETLKGSILETTEPPLPHPLRNGMRKYGMWRLSQAFALTKSAQLVKSPLWQKEKCGLIFLPTIKK